MEFKKSGKKFLANTLILEIGVVLSVVIIGSIIFHLIEGYTFFDSLYFIVMTMSTIGFGDITPHTQAGKIMVMIFAFMGVPLFISVSGLILESRFNKRIKGYVSKVYKEMKIAEDELQKMEKKVNKELGEVIEETDDVAEKIEDTAQDVKTTKRRVTQIEKEIKEESKKEERIEAEIKKPRWKKIVKK